jgi:hypothetical protein
MFLSTVLASVNENDKYYMFIPKQIAFWKRFGIKFVAIFVGEKIPDILESYKDNIILYDRNLNVNTAYIAQNIRIYYSGLLDLPDDEMVMITDMDMLPVNDVYYKSGLEHVSKDDFVYYRYVEGNQIFMCYNAAHPSCWSKVFGIKTIEDIDEKIQNNYKPDYNGVPGCHGWCSDQEIMYKHLIHYENLCILNRDIRRLEYNVYQNHLENNKVDFTSQYDDFHAHRDYYRHEPLIKDLAKRLGIE